MYDIISQLCKQLNYLFKNHNILMFKNPEIPPPNGDNGDDNIKFEEHKNDYNVLAYSRFIRLARPLAYSSEGGEILRKAYPRIVKPLYGISIGYVLADTSLEIYKAKDQGQKAMMVKGIDKFIWHSLASLLIPGVLINRSIYLTRWFITGKIKSPKALAWIPPLVGLFMIPFVVEPIDHGTDIILNNTTRKYYNIYYKT